MCMLYCNSELIQVCVCVFVTSDKPKRSKMLAVLNLNLLPTLYLECYIDVYFINKIKILYLDWLSELRLTLIFGLETAPVLFLSIVEEASELTDSESESKITDLEKKLYSVLTID